MTVGRDYATPASKPKTIALNYGCINIICMIQSNYIGTRGTTFFFTLLYY